MSTYQVGQILFLMANNSVFPVQVIEEIIKTTLEGQEKTYIVLFPNKEQTKSDISKLKGRLFASKTEVRNFMIKNATEAIHNMVSTAEKISIDVFDAKPENSVKIPNINQNIESHTSSIKSKKEYSLEFLNPEVIFEEEKNKAIMQQRKKDDIIEIDLGNGQIGKINQNELEKVQHLNQGE